MTDRSADEGDDRRRILVQNGEYWLVNNGDLAMLRVTLDRLHARWPRARVGVLTSSPLLLGARHPGTEPIVVPGPGGWPRQGVIGRVAARAGLRVVGPVSTAVLTVQDVPRRQLSRLRHALATRRGREDTAPTSSPGDVPRAVHTASLVVAMGGGYLTDVDPEQAGRTLDILAAAIAAGIPTAMVGQGIGPLQDEGLRERARQILPRVDLIALRERRAGPGLLAELGVPSDRVRVTGDDAIELARGVRTDVLGAGIGICLRIAGYSPVADAARSAVRGAVHDAARRYGAPLVPLIISEYRAEDRRSTLPLVEGYEQVLPALGRFVTPEEVARRVGRCRVLVTGAYHLAVFALSQGVPVVGLSGSRYYDDKLLGLADMFQGGLAVVQLHEPGLRERIVEAVAQAWANAPELRRALRERADEQVEASREAFSRIAALGGQATDTDGREPADG